MGPSSPCALKNIRTYPGGSGNPSAASGRENRMSFLGLLSQIATNVVAQTTRTYCFLLLEVRGPKLVCRTEFLPEALGENPFPRLLGLLEASRIRRGGGGLLPHAESLRGRRLMGPRFLPLFPYRGCSLTPCLLTRTLVITASVPAYSLHLRTVSHILKILFAHQVYSQALGIRTWHLRGNVTVQITRVSNTGGRQ